MFLEQILISDQKSKKYAQFYQIISVNLHHLSQTYLYIFIKINNYYFTKIFFYKTVILKLHLNKRLTNVDQSTKFRS
ncbi:hypothetical protein pb186bvf_011006 [Paramecium bursaria]